jgi:hypothetical protein
MALIRGLLFLCLVPLAFGFPNSYEAAQAAAAQQQYSGGPSSDGYGSAMTTHCTPYYETVYTDRCEQVNDRVCTTSFKEDCEDVQDQNCRAIVSGSQHRQCFNVSEEICTLKEEVQYDVVQAIFTVQKCTKVPEKICDTVYEVDFSSKEDVQCVHIPNPICNTEERTVYEKTCRTSTTFECEEAEESGYGQIGYGGSDGSSSGYASGNAVDTYGSSTPGPYVSSAPGPYGASTPGSYGSTTTAKCEPKTETKCHTIPRIVTTQTCSHSNEKVCERMSSRVPVPTKRQTCHTEEKKVCDLEQKTQPKQIKKYVYSKACRSAPKMICETADSKTLVPSCVATTRKMCRSNPVEKCDDQNRQQCFKVATKVRKEKCEQVPTYGSYPSTQTTTYSAPGSSSSPTYTPTSTGGKPVGYEKK